MTVGQLREVLAAQPDDRLVVLQKDAEGNGYSPLEQAEEAMYEAESTWSGEVYYTPEQLGEGDRRAAGFADAPDEAVRVVLLGPVN